MGCQLMCFWKSSEEWVLKKYVVTFEQIKRQINTFKFYFNFSLKPEKIFILYFLCFLCLETSLKALLKLKTQNLKIILLLTVYFKLIENY